jgi:two-component system, NtrC family, response regulator AlgB
VIERAVILCKTDRITPDLLPFGRPTIAPETFIGDPVTLDKVKELHIRRVLATSKSLEEAAKTLGIDVVTLWRMRKKLAL